MWLVKRLQLSTGLTFETQWGSLKCLFTDIRLGTIIIGIKHLPKIKSKISYSGKLLNNKQVKKAKEYLINESEKEQ